MSNPQNSKAMKKNFTIATVAVYMLAAMLLATGCKKSKKVDTPVVAIVESSVAVSYNKAWMVADVVDDGRGTIMERGFCYGKMGETPDTLFCEGNENPFSAVLPDLTPSMEYICRAFARNEAGLGFSELYRFTTMSDTIPLVDTYTVKNITHCSAVPSGRVLSTGGQTVEEYGICYSTESLPTIDGMHVVAGSGVGAFECQLTDLLPETRYYVRAYAVCTKDVYYGDQLNFDTKVLPMEVHTISVSDVTASRVKARGDVIRDGGYEVTECGFCWGTEHNPTVEGLHIKASVGLGGFSYYFSGLEKGQTHYVRAYAINEAGIAYGNELEFVPDDPFEPWPDGTLPGLFSVSEDRKVRFSQGNLQYYPDDNRWRFAEDQWDFVGGLCNDDNFGTMNVGTVFANGTKCDNTKIYKYYAGWMDLFGWGTSGWDNGNLYYRPYDFAAHDYETAYYGPAGNFDLTDDYEQADWGVHNTISNGGSRQWRTPTFDEINYILFERNTASGIRSAKAEVAGVQGLILLPDDWVASTFALDIGGYDYSSNRIMAREWLDVLEPAGAVFLPAAALRYEITTYEGIWYEYYASQPIICGGYYWTSTQGIGVDCATGLGFNGYTSNLSDGFNRCYGCSVRLISDE